MHIIGFLIVGLLAGWTASFLVEGHGLGAIGDMIVGVIGAFVGGFIFDVFGIAPYGFWGSFAMSVIGAMAFLFVVGLVRGRRKAFSRS